MSLCNQLKAMREAPRPPLLASSTLLLVKVLLDNFFSFKFPGLKKCKMATHYCFNFELLKINEFYLFLESVLAANNLATLLNNADNIVK